MSAIAGRVLLIPKGAYNALTTYNPLDFVTYGADSYVCKQTSTGNAPTNTTYWQLLAKGSTDADQIGYDNTASGLSATDVQAAVDELASEKQDETLSTPIVVEGVSKGTVEDALSGLNGYADDITDVISKNGAKNLLRNDATSAVTNGITFTVNSDGTITASGTASAEANCFIRPAWTVMSEFTEGQYHLSGCPANSGGIHLRALKTNWIDQSDDGSGSTFTIGSGENLKGVVITIDSGTAISGSITFKPMITLASQPDSDYAHYAPYAMTNRELTEVSIKTKVVQITTDSNGYATSNLDMSAYRIVNIITNEKNETNIKYRSMLDELHTVVYAESFDGNPKANATMSIRIFYF